MLQKSEAKLKDSSVYVSAIKLKNEDAVLAVVMASFGLKVDIIRLLSMEYLDNDIILDAMPKSSRNFEWKDTATRLGASPQMHVKKWDQPMNQFIQVSNGFVTV